MVREAIIEDLDQLEEFIWEKYIISREGIYPKIFGRDNLKKRLKRAHESGEEFNLIYKDGDDILGALTYVYIKEDQYLASTMGIFADRSHSDVGNKFIDYLKEKHKGMECIFGYSNKYEEAIEYVMGIGGRCIEKSILAEISRDDLNGSDSDVEVSKLEEKYYEEFSQFYDRYIGGAYWTSERLIKEIHLWDIYILVDKGRIISTIVLQKGNIPHIFALFVDEEYRINEVVPEFIIKALKALLIQDIDKIRYFIDEKQSWEVEISKEVGFKELDRCRQYKVLL